MAKKYNVWGLDPGTTNFGAACVQYGDQLTQYKSVYSGKVGVTVYGNMDDLPSQFDEFLAEMKQLFDQYPPDALVMERFMNRGSFSGDTGEYVSMMIALTIQYVRANYPDCYIRIAQPGVWKQAFNRSQGWAPAPAQRGKGKGKKAPKKPTPLDHLYAYTLVEPHELDAWLMAHFCASHWWEETPFSQLEGKDVRVLVERLELVATGKKKRKRKMLE